MNILRSGSRAAATSKVERFVIIVHGFQSLAIITKRSTLDVAAALDPPLILMLSTHYGTKASIDNCRKGRLLIITSTIGYVSVRIFGTVVFQATFGRLLLLTLRSCPLLVSSVNIFKSTKLCL